MLNTGIFPPKTLLLLPEGSNLTVDGGFDKILTLYLYPDQNTDFTYLCVDLPGLDLSPGLKKKNPKTTVWNCRRNKNCPCEQNLENEL